MGNQAIAQVALSQVGATFSRASGGGYDTPYGRADGISPSQYCAQFAFWCARQVLGTFGNHDIDHYTPVTKNWAVSNGIWATGAGDGEAGDLALFGWDDGGDYIDHAGVIIENLGGGRYITVEGNLTINGRNGVYKMTRSVGTRGIKGFIKTSGGGSASVPPYAAPAQNGGDNPFQVGASNTAIRWMQERLIGAGFSIPAGATGFYGTQTRAAVAAFQRAQGWRGADADGVVGSQSLNIIFDGNPPTTAEPGSAPAAPAGPVDRGPVYLSQLMPGQNNEAVARVQDALIQMRNGLNDPVMTRFQVDDKFIANYADWQRRLGYSGADADGIPGPASLAALGVTVIPEPAAPAPPAPTSVDPGVLFAYGATNEAVRSMQHRLIGAGYSIPAGATGYYGEQTKAAVAAFQRDQGWRGSDADGIVGSQSLNIIFDGQVPTNG